MLSQKLYAKRIYPIGAILVLAFSILARVLWVGLIPYNDLWETISSLYNPDHPEYNPVGAYFFWATMVTAGTLIIIMICYVHPRLVQVKKGFTRFGTFWMVIGGIGLLLVGLVPQHTLDFISSKFHEYSAIVGAVGVLFGAGCYGLTVIKGKIPVNRKLNIGITVMWWTLIALIVISVAGAYGGINPDWSGQDPIPGVSPFFSIAIWEKTAFWVMVTYLGLIGALVPDRIEPPKST